MWRRLVLAAVGALLASVIGLVPSGAAASSDMTIRAYDGAVLNVVISSKDSLAWALVGRQRPVPLGVREAERIGGIERLAAKAADEAATTAARVPSTQWGKTVADFRNNRDEWRRISAHAEEATSKTYRGGLSIEEVFERGGDRLVRHRVYGSGGKVLHETYRPYAKFGSP